MAKLKRYDIETDNGKYSITAVSKKDLKEYIEDSKLYEKSKGFIYELSALSVKTAPHKTPLAEIGLKYDDSQATKEGLIKIVSKKEITVKTAATSTDKKRDEIFDAMDNTIESTEKFDNIF